MSTKPHAGRSSRERKRDQARQADLMAEAERVARRIGETKEGREEP